MLNPANDRIELNSFAGDIYDDTINLITDIDGSFSDINGDITNLTDEIRQALKEGQRYNNVSISTKDGFKAERLSDGLVVLMNAYDCFKIQKSDGSYICYINDKGKFVTKGEFISDGNYGYECELASGYLLFRLNGEVVGYVTPDWSSQDSTNIRLAASNGKVEIGDLDVTNLYVGNIKAGVSEESGIDTMVWSPPTGKWMKFVSGVLVGLVDG